MTLTAATIARFTELHALFNSHACKGAAESKVMQCISVEDKVITQRLCSWTRGNTKGERLTSWKTRLLWFYQ